MHLGSRRTRRAPVFGGNFNDPYRVYAVSKFRSAVGHSLVVDLETCRSMKHYFRHAPGDPGAWEYVTPVSGRVDKLDSPRDNAGVTIQVGEYPAFLVGIGHVDLIDDLEEDMHVEAGDRPGTTPEPTPIWGGGEIDVSVNTPDGWTLVSYFETMTRGLSSDWQDHGLRFFSDVIIEREQPDAAPLSCQGGTIDVESEEEFRGVWYDLRSEHG